ncbi:MAG TPA: hypothetical protein VNE39_03015 [Planctomycetota bacterium]|nr:hypothetical protein [Planctomycetota bacterium]
MRGKAIRPGSALVLAATLLGVPGCSPLFKAFVYTCDRGMDALDMLDLGITVTPRFSLSAYACLLGLGGLGYGSVDGYFAGMGGSRVGIFRHYHCNVGIGIYAYEVTGWADFDVSKRETLTRRHRGPVAWFLALFWPRAFGAGPGQCVGPG